MDMRERSLNPKKQVKRKKSNAFVSIILNYDCNYIIIIIINKKIYNHYTLK